MNESTCGYSVHNRANNRPILKCGDMFVLSSHLEGFVRLGG